MLEGLSRGLWAEVDFGRFDDFEEESNLSLEEKDEEEVGCGLCEFSNSEMESSTAAESLGEDATDDDEAFTVGSCSVLIEGVRFEVAVSSPAPSPALPVRVFRTSPLSELSFLSFFLKAPSSLEVFLEGLGLLGEVGDILPRSERGER